LWVANPKAGEIERIKSRISKSRNLGEIELTYRLAIGYQIAAGGLAPGHRLPIGDDSPFFNPLGCPPQ
jgi:hypothetical protein